MPHHQRKNTRRKFIKRATLAAAGPAILNNPGDTEQQPQIIHHVFFWLKNPSSQADLKELIAGLKTLKTIPQVQQLLIGTPAATLKRDVMDNSFQVSELMYFNSAKDQDDYQLHPLHKAFVETYSPLWAKVVVYDMVTGSGENRYPLV